MNPNRPISESTRLRHLGRATRTVAVACALAGCSFYHSDPLATAPDLAPSVAALPGAGAPAAAIDMQAVATLAVLHNPDLVSSRRKAAVANAQAFAAGLLPDPQLTASVDHPTAAGFVNGYALGLSEDLQALLLHPSRAAAAQATADQAKLNSLWDEWQIIEKACTLYVQKSTADSKVDVLTRGEDVLATQSARSSRALAEHNTTLDQAGADLAAALDTGALLNTAQRDALTADVNLKALVDLRPDAQLALAGLGDPSPVTRDEFTAELDSVTRIRPDLLALQAGYSAQDEAVLTAILSQFPTLTFGANRQADTSNVHTTGLGVTLNLPIFTGARGEIRVQNATRSQLKAEYQARLDQTTADAWRLFQEIDLLQRQKKELEDRMPEFRRIAETGRTAYLNGDLPPATYVVMQTSLTARESELLDLKSSLWTDILALHTILGAPYVPGALSSPSK
jgi:outer membrane protein TolC